MTLDRVTFYLTLTLAFAILLNIPLMPFAHLNAQTLPAGVIGGVVAIPLTDKVETATFGEKDQLVIGEHVIVAISLDQEPKQYEVSVTYADGRTQTLPFVVETREFEEQHITIEDQNKVTPPPEFYERITKEAELMRKAYASETLPNLADLLPIVLPVKGITTGVFGTKRFFNGEARNPHSGVDYAADTGTPIIAPAPGTIVLTEELFYNGKTVVIDHGSGFVSVLCHMDSISVEVDDKVARGDVVGTVGSTGRSTGPHLHWTIALSGVKIDPEQFMSVVNDLTKGSPPD